MGIMAITIFTLRVGFALMAKNKGIKYSSKLPPPPCYTGVMSVSIKLWEGGWVVFWVAENPFKVLLTANNNKE